MTIHNKNTIEFTNSYGLYKFFESLKNLFDETEIVLENNQMTIRNMDMSRICMIDIKFNESQCICNIESYESKTLGINIDDLCKLLKTRKKDKKKVKFTFENDKLVVNKFNSKSNTKKTLGNLELDKEDIPIENLKKIDYTNIVNMDKTILDDFFYESGLYSEIITVKFDKQGLHFIESGQIGESDMLFEMEQLKYFKCDDIERLNYDKVQGSYSLIFLELVKGFLPIMDQGDNISFEIKTDHPLRITIDLESISCKMEFYLAPRVEEEDFDDDDDLW